MTRQEHVRYRIMAKKATAGLRPYTVYKHLGAVGVKIIEDDELERIILQAILPIEDRT